MSTDNSSNEVLDFSDLTPRVIKIRNLLGRDYELREANGDAEIAYHNAVLKNSELVGDKIVRLPGMADVGPMLLSLCLFDSDGKNVSTGTIRAWPARVQETLILKVKEISEIDQPDDDELEKQIARLQKKLADRRERHPNSQSSTATGSP